MLRLSCFFLACLRAGGLMRNFTTDLSILWSVQHSAPRIALVTLKSCKSDFLVMTKSMRCQCLERGCIQVVLCFLASWKNVLVMAKSLEAHRFSSLSPFSLMFPTPCFPMIPSQTSWFDPTRALKSPSRMTLSCLGMELRVFCSC